MLFSEKLDTVIVGEKTLKYDYIKNHIDLQKKLYRLLSLQTIL